MNDEYDNSDEGLGVADVFYDLYEALLRMTFLEEYLLEDEVQLVDKMLALVYNHNPGWVDSLYDFDEDDLDGEED